MARTSLRRRFNAFDVVNAIVLTLIALLCVYPFFYILAISFSDGRAVSAGEVVLIPRDFNLEAYSYVLTEERLGILRALLNSILYTVVGVAFSVAITYVTAYPLSKSRLVGGRFITVLFLITWVFDAGIVPTYIVNSQLGFVNNWLAIIIPWGFSTFLLLITIAYLRSIPQELEDAAYMDGANDWQILRRVYLPLSTPVLGTIGIFYGIGVWNSFLIPLIYFQDKALAPIQLVLYKLLIKGDVDSANLATTIINGHLISPQNIQAATMIFAIVPVLAFYPYAQRYFAKGILVGSVKD